MDFHVAILCLIGTAFAMLFVTVIEDLVRIARRYLARRHALAEAQMRTLAPPHRRVAATRAPRDLFEFYSARWRAAGAAFVHARRPSG